MGGEQKSRFPGLERKADDQMQKILARVNSGARGGAATISETGGNPRGDDKA